MRSRSSAAFSNSSASAQRHHLRLQVVDNLLLLALQEAFGVAHVAG
jgi:hypothetical protein